MMTEDIANLLIALIPSIIGILGIVGSAITCMKKVKDIASNDSDETKLLKEKMEQISTINIQLQQLVAGYIEKISLLEETITTKSMEEQEKINQIIELNTQLVKESVEYQELTEALNKIKAQLTALLKKGE